MHVADVHMLFLLHVDVVLHGGVYHLRVPGMKCFQV